MNKPSFPYPERILQWVWNEQLFDLSALTTVCGRKVTILDPGILNTSDGPDFKFSKIIIDSIEWHGSVELHLRSSDWYSHNHHTDGNYNNVILHVVTEAFPKQVKTTSGNSPFTLNILPHIYSPLEHFLKNHQANHFLPCSGNIRFISQEVFEQQINNAHQEYLEKKANDFLAFYNPGISQSKAWKEALIISIFDGFGISKNRQPMQKLAKTLISKNPAPSSALNVLANEIAFGSSSDLKWNYKGCRPNNHPAKRIETATRFYLLVQQAPFEDFLTANAIDIWKQWCSKIGIQKAGHPNVLFATVYLPALYLLSTIFHSKNLKAAVQDYWKTYQAPIPKSILSKFDALNVPKRSYRKKLGAVYQLKNYCNTGGCSQCMVLKKAISS